MLKLISFMNLTTQKYCKANIIKNIRSFSSTSQSIDINAKDIEAQQLLSETYKSICDQKFEDIVVIQTKFNADPRYIVLANAFNHRHLISGTEEVNKNFKQSIRKLDQDFAKLSISKGWNVIDFQSVVVHLFSKECRKQFDIEQLWTCGEKYDDLTNFGSPTSDMPENIASLYDTKN